MNREVRFTINERPIPQKRHRHFNDKTYNPQRKEKLYYGLLIKQLIKNYETLKEHTLCGPLHVSLSFFMALPKSKKHRESKGLFHANKPDLDNLIKFILDAMSGIVFHDDSYIYKIDAIKCYSEKPRTQVVIKEVIQEKLD